MNFSRKALWSFLVGTLAAVPALSGMRDQAPATPAEVNAEARTAPVPETRRVLEEVRQRDDIDDAPAPVAAIFAPVAATLVLAGVDRTATGRPSAEPDVVPLSRRALGRPRARAPDRRTAV